jgi:DNA replication protein DnaC
VTIPCVCVREKLEREKMERMLRDCELPVGTEGMTFERWEERQELLEAHQEAMALAGGNSKSWLTFMSATNRGKTHLLAAICRRWIADGKPARYAYVPLLLEELRRGFQHEGDYSYENRFDFFLKVPLLALDDLGTEYSTPWVQEKLDTIVDYRLMHGLALVVTTNLPMDELGYRIRSRLQRGGKIIYIDSPEYSTGGATDG